MRISSLYNKRKCVFSLEVFPPKKTSSIDSIYTTIDGLKEMRPDFISVTYGAGGNVADTKTRDIAEIIKRKYGIESMAHLTCVNTEMADAETILNDFSSHGIENVLALRGDINPDIPPKNDFKYASDLARYIAARDDFDIGGACYPEVHSEASDAESDLDHLKIKVDAGVKFLISQLFFDNSFFYSFRERAAKKGIFVPISAGIMPVTNKKQIERVVTMCGASVPQTLAKLMSKYADDPAALTEAGIEYAVEQITGLIMNGVDGVHLYTMNNPAVAQKIYDGIKGLL